MSTIASWQSGTLPTIRGSGVTLAATGGPYSQPAIQFDQIAGDVSQARLSFTSRTGCTIRTYLLTPSSWSSATQTVIDIRPDDATTVGRVQIGGTSNPGRIRLTAASTTVIAQSNTSVLAVSTWYRVEVRFDQANGRARVAVFQLGSDTALYDSDWTDGDCGSAVQFAEIGPGLSTVTSGMMRAAAITVTDDLNAWVGRASWDGAPLASPSDPIGLTDTVTVSLTLARAAADPVGITDLPGPQVLDVSLDQDDMVGVTDSVAQLMAAARTIADAAGITDSVTVVLDRAIAADDPIGVTDSAGTALDAGRSAVDAAGVGDQVSVTLVAARAVGDPIGVTDSVTATLTAAGETIVSDPAGITDEVTVSITSARGLADAAALTDSVLAILSATAEADDQVATSDSVGAITVAVRTVTDGVAIVDTVTATLIRAELPDTPPGRRLTVEYESRTVSVRPGRR